MSSQTLVGRLQDIAFSVLLFMELWAEICLLDHLLQMSVENPVWLSRAEAR